MGDCGLGTQSYRYIFQHGPSDGQEPRGRRPFEFNVARIFRDFCGWLCCVIFDDGCIFERGWAPVRRWRPEVA